MNGRREPVCARLMRADPVLADRMWSGGEREGGGIDRVARARAVLLCEQCPLRVECLASALPVAHMRADTTIVGGLTTPARARLQRLVADGLHAPANLRGVSSHAVLAWLREHPDAPDRARRQVQAHWSGVKRRWRDGLDAAGRVGVRVQVVVPAPGAMVQGELDLGL